MAQHKTIEKKQQKKRSSQKPPSLIFARFRPYVLFLILFVDILVVISIRTNFLDIPYERDEGSYSYYGKLVLDGKIPYRDFEEQKLPGLFYSYAAVELVFGCTEKGVHIGFILINIMTIITIFFIGKLWFDDFVGCLAAVSASILSIMRSMSGFTVQSEHVVVFYACAGLLLLLYGIHRKNNLLVYLSGLLFGLALFTKTNALFFCLFAFVVILYPSTDDAGGTMKSRLLRVGIITGGMMTIACIFSVYLMMHGAFDGMVYWSYTYPRKYVSEMPFSEGLVQLKNRLLSFFYEAKLLLPIAILGCAALSFIRCGRRRKAILFAFLALSLLAVVPGFYFYGHYFLMTVPVLSIFIGLAFKFMRGKLENHSQSTAFLAAAGLFAIVMGFTLSDSREYFWNPNFMKIIRDSYGENPFPEAKVIADFIHNHSSKQDKIAMIGSEPEIYFYSERDCPSRHSYFSFMVNDVPESVQMQNEYIRDIERDKPRYMIVFKHPLSTNASPNAKPVISDWLTPFLNKYYKLVGIADMISPTETKYVWYQDLLRYQPNGQFTIFTLERI